MLSFLPDDTFLKVLYWTYLGKKLDLNNPTSFNEKMQWLKIHDHNPEYVKWVDKIEAKNSAKLFLGEEHVVPLISAWEKAEDIDFSNLPDICVLKCNHDQGSTKIYRRGISNEDELRAHFNKRLKKSPYVTRRGLIA